MTGTTTLTLGGLLAALLVLLANLYPWWTGNRDLKRLGPFGRGFAGAALAASCPGGLLGWAHSRTGTLANSAGERGGTTATGAPASAALTSGQLAGLSATGAIVVVLGVAYVVFSYKAADKPEKRRLVGGAFVGSVFLLTAGVAGALRWLPGALNAAGDGIVTAFHGAGVL